MTGPFDWCIDPDVIVPEQQAVAVYATEGRDIHIIHIRQERSWCEDQDPIVAVQARRETIVALVYKLLDEARLRFELIEETGSGHRIVPRPDARIKAIEAARPDMDWDAVHDEFDAFRAGEAAGASKASSNHVPVRERKAKVEAALRSDPTRSNRAIAAECGVSDKTVACVRAEIRTSDAEIRTEQEDAPLLLAAE